MSSRHLSLAHLETVAWIARLGSFTAAAGRLYTTQPAISARVRDLEATLGVKVFRRTVRGVELTIEGREFVQNVEPLLLQLERLSQSIRSTDSVRGTIRIGAGNIAMEWFPELAVRLRETMPKVNWDVAIGQGARMMRLLEGHKLDLAVVSAPVDEARFTATSLGFDRMIWAATPALVDRYRPFDLDRFLQAVPIWCVQRDSFYWQEAVSMLSEHGVDPRSFNGIDNLAAATRVALHGGGICLLSETMARDELESGRLVRIPDLPAGNRVEFRIVAHKGDERPLIAAVVEAAARVSTFERLDATGTPEQPVDP